LDESHHEPCSGAHWPLAPIRRPSCPRYSAWLTGIYFFVELAIGVTSDAFHTFSAVGGDPLVAQQLGERAATTSKRSAGSGPRSSARNDHAAVGFDLVPI